MIKNSSKNRLSNAYYLRIYREELEVLKVLSESGEFAQSNSLELRCREQEAINHLELYS